MHSDCILIASLIRYGLVDPPKDEDALALYAVLMELTSLTSPEDGGSAGAAAAAAASAVASAAPITAAANAASAASEAMGLTALGRSLSRGVSSGALAASDGVSSVGQVRSPLIALN